MLKKFKVGDKVRMTAEAASWFVDNAKEVYSQPSTGTLAPCHALELLALEAAVWHNEHLDGQVTGYGTDYHNDGVVKVELRSWYGTFDGYMDPKELVRLKPKKRKKRT